MKEIKKLDNKTLKYINNFWPGLKDAAQKRFGSWRAAIAAAGFDYDKIRKSYTSEEMLFDILKNLITGQIKRQKTFNWLKYKKNLYLDFYIESLNIAIEYQGRQHYEPVRFGGVSNKRANKSFNINKKRDSIKRKLLKKHGIKLIEIKYTEQITEENIKRILTKNGVLFK